MVCELLICVLRGLSCPSKDETAVLPSQFDSKKIRKVKSGQEKNSRTQAVHRI